MKVKKIYRLQLILKVIRLIVSISILSILSQPVIADDFGDYEIFSMSNYKSPELLVKESIFKLSPRNAINSDGLGGFFVGNTADRFVDKQFILSGRYKYRELNSTYGTAFKTTEDGRASTFEASLTWIGDWADWSMTVPVHDWELNAIRTFGGYPESNMDLGNVKLACKATYLPDKSYYRFAYGAVITLPTGNPEDMLPSGSTENEQLKFFGCVTTNETDRAKANIEMGYVIDSKVDESSHFIYRLGLSYEALEHVSLIGEIVGDVYGSDDKDTMDMVMGFRVAPTDTLNFEMAYYKNLRTYRAYGWDGQIQAGCTVRFK